MIGLVRGTFLLLLGCCASLPLLAQSSATYSPYSRYGLGDRVVGGYSHSLGMGGVSQGLRLPNVINPLNPASYTQQDTMSFIFEMGVSARYYMGRSADGRSFQAPTSSVDHMAIQVPLQKWGGLALGFQPYTTVGYDVHRYEQDVALVSRLGQIRYNHRGSGGLNEAFLGFAVEPFSFLSLGVNGRFVFGSINHQQDMYISSNALYANVYTYTRSVVRGFIVSPGVQLHFDFGDEKPRTVVLGGTLDWTPPMRTELRHDMRHELMGREVKIVDNRLSSQSTMSLPLRLAFGAYYRDANWSLGGDVAMQDWRGFRFGGGSTLGGSSMVYALGGSWTPNALDLRNYAKRMEYKAGLHYEQLPIVLDGMALHDFYVSFGVSLPFRHTLTRLHLSGHVGRRGQLGGRMIEELYMRLHVGVSLNDIWFVKYKYN